MRLDSPLSITGTRLWVPAERMTAAEAVAAEVVRDDEAAENGYTSLPVSPRLAAPEMAVLAAREAVADAGGHGEQLGLVVHAWLYHQGHDFWSPSHYVAREMGASSAVAVGVQQMCNGGAAAVDIAAARLVADHGLRRALVTTADRFEPPGFNRWGGDYGVAYGDGATALVLDRDDAGPYRLLSTTTVSAPDLERMHRGRDVFSPAPGWHSGAIDIRRTKKAFMADGGGALFSVAADRAVNDVIVKGLAEAGLSVEDPRLRCVTLPRLGRGLLDKVYIPAVRSLVPDRVETLDFGQTTGHLGAGDALAGLAEIHAAAILAAGEVAVLLSAGGGFSWAAMVVQAA